MVFRDYAPLLVFALLPACADFFGGRGDYGSSITSRETWENVFDIGRPHASFRVEVQATPEDRTTLNWSELAIIAGWESKDAAAVDVELLLDDDSLGSFVLGGSAADHTEAGTVELARVAPFVVDICVDFSLRAAGTMEIVVNGAVYSYDIEKGSDIDARVAIIDEPCG